MGANPQAAYHLPPMSASAEVLVQAPRAGSARAALFGPFGDCAVVLLAEGGYGDAECWIESAAGRISYAELVAANRAGLIRRAT